MHAAGSGVGTAAIQLGAALGAFVIGSARTPDKLERARPLGLDAGVVTENGRFADAVKRGRIKRLALERVDGDPVVGSVYEEPLIELGFRAGPRKLTLTT